MFWNEDENSEAAQVPDDIVDLLFMIDCRRLPVDHAHLLSSALQAILPWMAQEPGMAVHTIHVAGSQNGWERPEHGTDSDLLLSRRTKLTIRVPKTRIDAVLQQLPGSRIQIAGNPLIIGSGKVRPLSKESTLFARYVVIEGETPETLDESDFLDSAAQTLSASGIQVRKALCGKTRVLVTPNGSLYTRSLMLAGLTIEESIRLQQCGLGSHRLMGCGVFIPHKGIDSARSS